MKKIKSRPADKDSNDGKHAKKSHYGGFQAISVIISLIKNGEEEERKLVRLAIQQAERDLEVQDLKKKYCKQS